MQGSSAVAGDRLRSLVERIERIEEEIKGLNNDKKDIFMEAIGEGFDVKILREVVRLRKQDKDERDEQESLLDVYMHRWKQAARLGTGRLDLTRSAGFAGALNFGRRLAGKLKRSSTRHFGGHASFDIVGIASTNSRTDAVRHRATSTFRRPNL